jgi:virginiamycin B lyase
VRRVGSVVAVLAFAIGCSGGPAPAASPVSGGSARATTTTNSSPVVPASRSTSSAAVASVTPSSHPLAAVTRPMDDLKATRLTAEVKVGLYPDWQANLADALWVSTGEGVVARIDQSSNTVVARVPVEGPCLGMAGGFGSVWAPACEANELDRIDPKTNTVVARIKVPGIPGDGEGQIVAAAGSVWMFTDDAGTLIRIDPRTNTIAATYRTGVGGISLVTSEGSLWATVPTQDAVARISADGKVLQTIPVGREPRFIAAGEGGIWSLGQGDGDVTRIDPKTGMVVATIPAYVPGEGGCIAAGGGSIWVTMPQTPVTRIDPATNQVVERFTGPGGDCISFAAGSVWLSNLKLQTVWRIKP